MDILNIFAADSRQIIYRPELRQITGGLGASILLQQILFRWTKNGGTPFFKFKEPCSNPSYKKGDSWTEELGMTRREFDSAMKLIGVKIKGANYGKPDQPEAFVHYWTDMHRKTWYSLNISLLRKKLTELYVKADSAVTKSTNAPLSGKGGERRYVKADSAVPYNRDELYRNIDEQSEISAQARDDEPPKKMDDPTGQNLEGQSEPNKSDLEKEKKVALKKRKEILGILEIQLGEGYFKSLPERDFNSEKTAIYQLELRMIDLVKKQFGKFDEEMYVSAFFQFAKSLSKLSWWRETMVTVGMIDRNFIKILQNLKTRKNEPAKVNEHNIDQLIDQLQNGDPFGE